MITYSHNADPALYGVITLTSNGETTLNDIYLADKAGNLQLEPATGFLSSDSGSWAVQMRTAEEKVLPLKIEIQNFSAAGTITLNGKQNGVSISEVINITGDGTYTTSRTYSEITSYDMTGTYEFRFYQDRWGIISKLNIAGDQWEIRATILGDDGTTLNITNELVTLYPSNSLWISNASYYYTFHVFIENSTLYINTGGSGYKFYKSQIHYINSTLYYTANGNAIANYTVFNYKDDVKLFLGGGANTKIGVNCNHYDRDGIANIYVKGTGGVNNWHGESGHGAWKIFWFPESKVTFENMASVLIANNSNWNINFYNLKLINVDVLITGNYTGLAESYGLNKLYNPKLNGTSIFDASNSCETLIKLYGLYDPKHLTPSGDTVENATVEIDNGLNNYSGSITSTTDGKIPGGIWYKYGHYAQADGENATLQDNADYDLTITPTIGETKNVIINKSVMEVIGLLWVSEISDVKTDSPLIKNETNNTDITLKIKSSNSGLDIKITIYSVDGATKLVDNQPMSEIGNTHIYKYDWAPTINGGETVCYIINNYTYKTQIAGEIYHNPAIDPITNTELKDLVLGGREIIDESNGTFKVYKSDNTTLLRSFQLKDKDGNITDDPMKAYERVVI